MIARRVNSGLTLHSPFSCCPALYDFQLRRCVLQTFLDFDSTERLLDAVVPFIALRPRIESMWKHGVHIRGKDTTFRRSFCVRQFSFAESHYWYTDSYPHKRPKNSWKFSYGIKLGLTHKTYDIKRPVEESYQKRLARQVIFAPKLGQWNYLVKPANWCNLFFTHYLRITCNVLYNSLSIYGISASCLHLNFKQLGFAIDGR